MVEVLLLNVGDKEYSKADGLGSLGFICLVLYINRYSYTHIRKYEINRRRQRHFFFSLVLPRCDVVYTHAYGIA